MVSPLRGSLSVLSYGATIPCPHHAMLYSEAPAFRGGKSGSAFLQLLFFPQTVNVSSSLLRLWGAISCTSIQTALYLLPFQQPDQVPAADLS